MSLTEKIKYDTKLQHTKPETLKEYYIAMRDLQGTIRKSYSPTQVAFDIARNTYQTITSLYKK